MDMMEDNEQLLQQFFADGQFFTSGLPAVHILRLGSQPLQFGLIIRLFPDGRLIMIDIGT